MPKLVRLPPVRGGAHVRIVSPAMPTAATLPDRMRRGEQVLRSLGFKVSWGQHALDQDGAAPRDRAADLTEAFEDPAVAVVLSADAGDSTEQVLDFLDPEPFLRNPKPFVGYCDNVFFQQYLASAGLPSLYGCTLMSHLGEAPAPFPETLEGFIRALASDEPLTCKPAQSRTGEFINWYLGDPVNRVRRRCIAGGWTWLRPGDATGQLVGGELRLVSKLVHRFDLSLESKVLFWHLAFRGPDPEATFRALANAVDLTVLAGMIVGTHPTIPPPEWAARIDDLIEELLPDARFPVLANADISHVDPAWTVPFGEQVSMGTTTGLTFPRNQHTIRERDVSRIR